MVRTMAVCLFVAFTVAQAPGGGVDLAAHGHWKRLKPLAESRTAANPNDAEAQWLLSRVRSAYKDPDGALAPAEKAAALDPKNADYRWQIASVVGDEAQNAGMLKGLGLAKRFRRETEAALALNPKHVPSLNGLMEYYYQAPGIVGGDKKKAEEIANQIAAINNVDGAIGAVLPSRTGVSR